MQRGGQPVHATRKRASPCKTQVNDSLTCTDFEYVFTIPTPANILPRLYMHTYVHNLYVLRGGLYFHSHNIHYVYTCSTVSHHIGQGNLFIVRVKAGGQCPMYPVTPSVEMLIIILYCACLVYS